MAWWILLGAGLLAGAPPAGATAVITEFMADNTRTLLDDRGFYEDWIEIQNQGSNTISLEGWSLTDSSGDLRKWKFPAYNLAPGAYVVVFASGVDRKTAGLPFHTSFKLAADGEYLALVHSNGTKRTEFSPKYPKQFPDVSYGLSHRGVTFPLIASNAPVRYAIPTDGSADGQWIGASFDEDGWLAGTNGLGYESGVTDAQEDTYAGRAMELAPVAYWRLNETNGTLAANLGSYGISGEASYQGDTVIGSTGPRPPSYTMFESDNRAPTFSGASGFVSGPNGLLDNLAQFTMAGWVKLNGPPINRIGLFGQNDVVEFGFMNSTNMQLWTWYGSLSYTWPFGLGTWHHVAAVGNGSELQLYLDGQRVASTASAPTSYGAAEYTFNIAGGGIFDASGNFFNGQIDEVSVWWRGLSSNEISALASTSSASSVSYTNIYATDVGAAMLSNTASAYVRIPFVVENPSTVDVLTLKVQYDDGFVAYLNGQEITRRNAPESPAWDSTATARRRDPAAVLFESVDATALRYFLSAGTNVLAVHGLNIAATNTDFLLRATLDGGSTAALSTDYRYLTVPSPGSANGYGAGDLGPVLTGVGHSPPVPADADSLTVTAAVMEAFQPVASVTLNYRVLFGVTNTLTMNDGGTNGDAVAGDGVWSAVIPAAAATTGQMIRYFIAARDATNAASRWPIFPSTNDSEAFQGTVVLDPAIQSALPVMHQFVENAAAIDTRTGGRMSLFYDGELYDNVLMSLHGQSSAGWAKKSYNFDFPSDHQFRYRPDGVRQKDMKILSNYGDKSRTHNALAHEMAARAGSGSHWCFQIRVQRNAAFWSIGDMMEDSDDLWLQRLDRDPNGALYKMYNNLSGTSGNEKKTRLWESSTTDLQGLIDNLAETLPLATRVTYAWDHLDLPQAVSYFTALALASSQDHGHKNYYVYCDNDGTGEWGIYPWDVDLTWGRNWLDSPGYFTDTLFQTNVIGFYNGAQQNKTSNRLYNVIFDHPDFRRMYLRRLRTIMDTLLMPPGTASNALSIETRIRERMDAMDPPAIGTSDADLDYAKWGTWGSNVTMRQEAQRILDEHLPGRRDYLYNSINATLRGEAIPGNQPADVVVQVAGFDYNPASGNQLEEYVQLTNANAYAVDVSGWRIDGGASFTFRSGTVIPAYRSLYVSPSVRAFRLRATGPRGGQSLFVTGDYDGQLNAWGETVALYDPTGRVVHTNTFVGTPSDAQRYLRITEIMYNPAPSPDVEDPQQLEYVELRNVSSNVALSLAGVRFTNGIQFAFSSGSVTSLAPGAYVLLVRNRAAFTSHYGSVGAIAGEFAGMLDNGGENLRLEDAKGEKILDFSYNNAWYPITDGLGFSLVIVDDQTHWSTWGQKASWRASGALGGSPGGADPAPPAFAPIRIHEALTHTDPPELDAVELYNPGTPTVAVGGWFLTDDFFAPKKFRIPDGASLAPGGFLVFDADDFGVGANGFLLSSVGDEVWLFSGDATTNLTGYYHGFDFGASPNGISFGRHVTSEGEEHFVLQSTNTLGGANAPPRVGPVVISEIMYHPPDVGGVDNDVDEFVELMNITATNVPLYDPAAPTNTWRLRDAVDYEFPTNVILASGSYLLVVGFPPTNAAQLAAFRATYGVSVGVPIFGPWAGKLDNSSDPVELKAPDSPNVTPTNVVVPHYLVDKVKYRDLPPWPVEADGLGNSLQRLMAAGYGNDPTNWAVGAPTAGRANTVTLPPTVEWLAPTSGARIGRTPPIVLQASASDPDGTIAHVRFFEGTNLLGTSTGAPYTATWSNAPFGAHTLHAQAEDNAGAIAETPAVTLTVTGVVPVAGMSAPAAGAVVLTGALVTVTATAAAPDSAVAYVNFFVDGVFVSRDTNAPYQLQWTASPPGYRALAATATDVAGSTSAVAQVSVFVQAMVTITQTLVPAGAVWKYLDNGSNQGTNWVTPNFNDAAWGSGTARLGYGGDGEVTTLGYGGIPNNKYITYYFRRKFVAPDFTAYTSVVLRIVRDDGAVAYLNGAEVARQNMPAGVITYTNLASGNTTDEQAFFPTNIPIGLLQTGTNTLAVEVHQVSRNSSDMGFNANLVLSGTLLGPAITSQPAACVAFEGSNAVFTVGVMGSPTLRYQWFFNGGAVAGQTNASFVRNPAATNHAGAYFVLVSNAVTSVTSTPATLEVVVDLDRDHDGLPNDWELANGTDPDLADAGADPDGDRFTNEQEYWAGTSPTNGTSFLRLIGLTPGAAEVLISFPAASNRAYTVEHCPAPETMWSALTNLAAQPSGRVATLSFPLPPCNACFRVHTP